MHQPRAMRRLIGSVAAIALFAACGDRGTIADPVNDAIGPSAPPTPVTDAGADAAVAPSGTLVTIPYWHIERPADSKRAWMVDPSGHRVFVLGLDGFFDASNCDGMANYLARTTPAKEWSAVAGYGFNSAGVSPSTPGSTTVAPYSVIIDIQPSADDHALKDASGDVLVGGFAGVKVADPFHPAFATDLDHRAQAEMVPRRADPNVQIYYAGDEAGMFDVAGPSGGVRDFRRWIWSDCPNGSTSAAPKCAPEALAQFLGQRYSSAAALDAAWSVAYASFDDVMTAKPVPGTASCNPTCASDLSDFVVERLIPKWVSVVTIELRSGDENRLIAGPRLALGNSSQFHFWTAADTYADDGTPVAIDLLPQLARFDLVALDVFTSDAQFETPWLGDGIARLAGDIGLPLVVGATGVETEVPGWGNQTPEPAFVADQPTRGERYAAQLEELAAFDDVIGVHWHAWSDRYVEGVPSEQLERGLVQCTDVGKGFLAGTPWTAALAEITAANTSVPKSLR